jgi:hypothetical protein
MKVSRTFVKWFLGLFLSVIIANVVTLILGVWNLYYLIVLCGFVIFLFFLIYRKKDNGTVKFFKLLVLIIPVLIVGFIFYSNFLASHEFVYFYDIGSEQDVNRPFLTPLNRISEANLEESYRNLTSQLVYFDVKFPRGSNDILIEARIFSPVNESIRLGARDKQEWSYLNKEFYNPFLESLNLTERITRLNPEMPKINFIDEIPFGSVVATDLDLPLIVKQQEFEIKETTINHYLRGSHTFYIYLKDSLDLYVEKQDINWYEGEDFLVVSLFDLNGTLLGNVTLEDEGVIDTSKAIMPATSRELKIQDLSEGVYRLEFQGNADTIIAKLRLNTNKIITNRIFSAESANYLLDEDRQVEFFAQTEKESSLTFQTWHETYLQNISIGNQVFEIQEREQAHTFNIQSGDYKITLPKSNVIVSSQGGLTFSQENYFQPFEYPVVGIPSRQEDLTGIDYIITNYIPSKQDQDWKIVSVEFEMKDLYINNGELSLMFNVPHLAESRNKTNMQHVKVDWIKTTIQKDGIFKI